MYVQPKDFSLSPVDLIEPDTDEDTECHETTAKLARYARLGRLVDPEDIIEVVLSRLRETPALYAMVADSLTDPHEDPADPRCTWRTLSRWAKPCSMLWRSQLTNRYPCSTWWRAES